MPDIVSIGEPLVEFNQARSADPHTYLQGFGGDTSNMGIAAARLGAKVAYVTRLGADRFGRMFVELWTSEGVDTTGVTLDPETSAAISLPRMVPSKALRLSTAVLLSARFPVISPIAIVRNATADDELHIVDGGYADNSGTVTAAEVVAALHASAARLGLQDKVRTVGIVITDNPVEIGEKSADADRKHRENLERTAAGAVLAPFETMDRIRQSLSAKHRAAFSETLSRSGGEVLDGFALQASRIEFPLGWMLSHGTRTALTDQIETLSKDPSGDFERIRRLIRQTRESARTGSK